MFVEFVHKENDFYNKYLRSFSARSSVSSVNLEENVEDFATNLAINGHLDACDYIFENFADKDISMYDLPDIIKLLTNGEVSDFRKIPISVMGSNCERTKPYMIKSDLYQLFKEYHELKAMIQNPYLREAIFHIKFLKIHPFEDGNGRCARLISCFNLCQNDLAPFVIPRDRKAEYCECIENNDYDKLAKMFEELSLLELETMLDIYRKSSLTQKTR